MPFSLEQMDRQYRAGGVTAALGLPVDRLHRGVLRRRRHRGQQRAVPPAARRRSSTAGAPSTAIADSRPDELYAICDEVERDARRADRARRPDRRPARRCAAAPRALGWRHDEIPRWMTYPAGADARQGRRQSMTRDLPAPRRRRRGPAASPATASTGSSSTAARVRRAAADHGRRPRRHGRLPRTSIVCGGAIQTPALLQRSGLRRRIGRTPRRAPDGEAGGPLRRRAQRRRRRARAPGQGVRARPVVRRLGVQPGPRRAGAQRRLGSGSGRPSRTGASSPCTTRRSPARAAARVRGAPRPARPARHVPPDPPRPRRCSAAAWPGSRC